MWGAEARSCARPADGIQCGRGGVVLGGMECAALRVVCRERRGIMRMCCGQQHRCRCWCERCGSHRGVQRAAWHHADVLWAAAQVPVLVREVRELQGRRVVCVEWSHQVRRVSLGRAGRCRVGSGCPGLPKRAPLVGPGSSQLTSMQHRGWCVVGAYDGWTNYDCRFVLGIVGKQCCRWWAWMSRQRARGHRKHRHVAPVEECG
jgi:hypothetical protein